MWELGEISHPICTRSQDVGIAYLRQLMRMLLWEFLSFPTICDLILKCVAI